MTVQVRREFVTKLLARKTLPKGASIFIAECLIREPALINDYHASSMTNELLGVPKGQELRKFVTDLPPTGDGRAQVLTLAVVLGALEARTPKDAWRSGGRHPFMRYSVGSRCPPLVEPPLRVTAISPTAHKARRLRARVM